ncbi:protein prenyltransferase alpha subunit repeat-containing protein 1 [Nematolebias whitei]|uniref:protein prenyltransferase alpha subunit repeat-containing protein 1 n=1 Tax=Nematolebias whitei TaxID=451745 RepID=UPI00189ABCA9|nr:protein prenyltransferase alpha subunit repeat-containing protein 1 [Nematolebias whitei]
MQSGVLNPEKDLYLGKLALTKFPKSPESWIHRRWVLQHMLRQLRAVNHHKSQQEVEAEVDAERTQHVSDQLSRIIYEEMTVCSDAACRYPSNYNAWSHRIWVLRHMAKGNIKGCRDIAQGSITVPWSPTTCTKWYAIGFFTKEPSLLHRSKGCRDTAQDTTTPHLVAMISEQAVI